MEAFALIVLFLGFVGGQVVSVPLFAGARLTLLDMAVGLLLLFAAYRGGKKRFLPRLWAPILGFAAVTLLSLAATWGNVPMYVVGGGLLYILRWMIYAALYWVAASSLIAKGLWYGVLIASVVELAILGVLQYILYPDLRNLFYLGWDPHYQRLFSTLFDPNFMGILLALTSLALISMLRNGKQLAWIMGIGAITITSLLLTYSRSSLIAFAIGLALWGILMKRKMLALGVISVLLGAMILLPRSGEGRNVLRTVSAYARLGSADRAITLIKEKPLLGHGFNILRFVSRERSWIDETVIPSRAGAGLDTSLLFVGATTGIVGILVYGWMLVRLFGLGRLALRSKKTHDDAALYLSLLVAILVHSMFINSLFYPWVMAWLWITTGALEQSVRAGT